MGVEDWFLGISERGNPGTAIDAPHGGRAWSEGNHVTPLIDGMSYFRRLAEVLSSVGRGHRVRFTDWRSDGDERLDDGGPEVATLLAQVVRRGADVRGLVWRSHTDRLSFSSKENRRLADEVNGAGGEVLLDERVRRGGSHHQKLVVVRHPDDPDEEVAFVGGIDLCHGRRDDTNHLGDVQAIRIDRRYGPRPPWHDVQIEVRGPAVADLDRTFEERWSDPTPLDHSNIWRASASRVTRRSRRASALPDPLKVPPGRGTHAVQVLRTYPVRRPRYPFAPHGERSVARAFAKAADRARALVYIEDQFFWSEDAAEVLAGALERQRELRVIIVVPRYPDKDGRFSGPPSRISQLQAVDRLRRAGGARVAIYNLENTAGTPIYVHAKVCIIDDVWASIGSDNLNRRSWTHDSEVACAVIDSTLDRRTPADPGGMGDGSRLFARDLRLSLWAEHLGRSRDDPGLLDPISGFNAWRDCASALDAWDGKRAAGHRPPGRARFHEVAPVAPINQSWARVVSRLVFDPDGRPLRLRRVRQF